MSSNLARDSDLALPELGVGVTYMPALEPLLNRFPDLVDVIEIEPQTLWISNDRQKDKYRALDGVFENIAALPFRKLVHSVGVPVGGSVKPEPQNLSLLARNVELLQSPWVSDHLSFNATPEFHTGFFLPPRQTQEGIDNAVAAIRELQLAIKVPVAVETGVNYFQSRADEIPDGLFVADIAKRSGCGILLDLHNLYCNQINGRQTIDEFLAQISFQHVWEVHLAGGLEMDGYWLDAHSGAIPVPLVELCRHIFPRLTNLKAVIFEIFPSFVAEVGLETVRKQIEVVRELWELRGRSSDSQIGHTFKPPEIPTTVSEQWPPTQWEEALGALVIGRNCNTDIAAQLARDPAVSLVRGLIHEFRGSMVVSVLRLTSRLLILCLGADGFTLVLREFWSKNSPRQFASDEAEAFAEYLIALDLTVPHLMKTLEFERAAVATLLTGESRVVSFDFDPFPLFRALSAGRLPELIGRPGKFEIELDSNDPVSESGLDVDSVRRAFPFH